MEGKKRYIVAIVLFILLGLTVFTFASTSDDETVLDGSSVTDETEGDGVSTADGSTSDTNTESDDNTTNGTVSSSTSETNSNSRSGSSGTSGSSTYTVTVASADNSYDLALAAVEKAESSLTQSDVDSAKSLIANVSDADSKSALETRINAVQSIIDATELVNTLKSMVDSSTSLANMKEARDYESANAVIATVNALAESTTKSELQEILDELSVLLDDEEAPVISVSGINADNYAKGEVNVSVEEANSVTLYLNGVETTIAELQNLADGTYEVKAVDASFNETSITFTVDNTTPVINNIKHGKWYTEEVTIDVEEENVASIVLETIEVINGVEKSLGSKEIENETALSDEYKYVLTVTDKAGNSTTVAFGIDYTSPVITLNGTEYNESKSETIYLNSDVKVNITDNTLYSYSVTKDGEDQNWSEETTYEEEGTYVVTAKDKTGKTVTITFVIDKTAPQIQLNEKYTVGGAKGSSSYSKIGISEIDETGLAGLYINGEKVKDISGTSNQNNKIEEYFASNLNEGAENTIYVMDVAGNKSNVITFVYDTTAATRVFSTLDFDGTGKEYYEENGNKYYYVKNGDSFVFRMKFSEELAEVPTVTIGGQTVEMELLENLVTKNNEYVYQGTFTIAEDETQMSEGQLEIVVSNVVDLAGNETEDSIQTPTSNGRVAIYDRTRPELNVSNGNIVESVKIEASDDNYGYMIITNRSTGEIVKTTEATYEINYEADNVRYTIVAYDKAGNKAGTDKYEQVDVYIDNQNPVISATGVVAGESVNASNNGVFQSLTVEVSDGSLKKVILIDNDNNEETVLKEFDNNYTSKVLAYEQEFTTEGTYTIKAIDRYGHESEFTFTIDKTAAVIEPQQVGIYDAETEMTYYNQSFYYKVIDDNLDTVKFVATLADGSKKNGTLSVYSGQLKSLGEEGTYTLTVTDKAGNVTQIKFVVDKTSPVIGDVPTDGAYTNESVTPTITDANLSTITVTLDGASYTYEEGDTLSTDGVYVITATDKAGNETSTSFTIDKTAATVAVDNETNGYVNTNTFSISINDQNPFTFDIYYEDTKIHSSQSKLDNNNLSYDRFNISWLIDTYGDGTYKIEVTDAAGNVTTHSFVLDTAVSVAQFDVLNLGTYTTYSKGAVHYIKNGESLRVIARYYEELSVVPTLFINGTEIGKLTYDSQMSAGRDYYAYTIDYKITGEESWNDGTIIFKVNGAQDAAGNSVDLTNSDITGAYASSIVLDNTLATATFDPDGSITNQSNMQVKVSIIEENIDSVYYLFSGWDNETDLLANKSESSWQKVSSLSDEKTFVTNWDITNSSYLWVKVIDKAGNISYTKSSLYTYDTTLPYLTYNNVDYTDGSTITFDKNDGDTITVYLKDNVGVASSYRNGALRISGVEGNYYDSFGTSNYYGYTIVITDTAGNEATIKFTYNATTLLSEAIEAVNEAKSIASNGDADATQEAIDKATSIVKALASTKAYPTETTNLENSLTSLQTSLNNSILYNKAYTAVRTTAYNAVNSGDTTAAYEAIAEAQALLDELEATGSYTTERTNLQNDLNNYTTTVDNKVLYNKAYTAVRTDVKNAIASGDYTTASSAITTAEELLEQLEATGSYTTELAILKAELADYKSQLATLTPISNTKSTSGTVQQLGSSSKKSNSSTILEKIRTVFSGLFSI